MRRVRGGLAAGVWLLYVAAAPAWAVQAGTADATPPTPAAAQDNALDYALTVGQLADIYIARREYNTTLAFLTPLVRNHHLPKPLRATWYNRMGIAEQQLELLQPAERDYKQAHNLDKKNARYINNLGTVYYVERKYKPAAKQFAQAVRLDPGEATYYVNMGGAEFALKRVQQAMMYYRDALMIDPTSLFPEGGSGPLVKDPNGPDAPEFHYELARLLCSLGMINNAVHEFEQAYDLHYANLAASLTDPAFAPLRLRPEYRMLMGLPPNPPLAAPAGAPAATPAAGSATAASAN